MKTHGVSLALTRKPWWGCSIWADRNLDWGLCSDVLARYFDIPDSARRIWLRWSLKPVRDPEAAEFQIRRTQLYVRWKEPGKPDTLQGIFISSRGIAKQMASAGLDHYEWYTVWVTVECRE